MAQSVSNDALWEKMSEIEEKIDKQGTHCDSHFKTIRENIKLSNELTKDEFQILSYMWAWMQEKEKIEQEKVKLTSAQEADNSYLNLRFFKVRKTSVVITILGLLVFILTVFSMKQQNDYSLLLDKHYRKSIIIEQFKVEMDSINKTSKERIDKKKR